MSPRPNNNAAISNSGRGGSQSTETRAGWFLNSEPRTQNSELLRPSRLPPSSSGEHRAETGLGQNSRNRLALVTLDLDPSFLQRATGAAGFLHLLGERLFFIQTDAGESSDDRYGLATSVRSLTNDIDSSTVFLPRDARAIAWAGIGPHLLGKR